MYDLIPQNNEKKEPLKKGGLAVLLVIVVFALLIAAITKLNSVYSDTAAPKGSSLLSVFRAPKEYIAAIHIEGVIEAKNNFYDQNWLLKTISNLEKDSFNIGIFLVIDSPGGGVYEADEAYLALMDYKAHTGRPIYAYMQTLAASGGYYIACSADKIIANRNTLTGSIGVISGSSVDISELLEKYGIKYTTVTAGRNKNMGNLNEPFSEEQKEIMQSIADECYEQFTSIVSQSRNMEIATVKTLADGRIYTAKQALENGLIDAIGRWSEAIDTFSSDCNGGESDFEVVDYFPENEKKFLDYLIAASSEILPKAVSHIFPKITFPAYLYTQR